MAESYKRNRFTFGLGTVGRDMAYSLVSMYLMFYLTDILKVTTAQLWWITGIFLVCRVYDALNDPIMGVIVDNTNTRWGRFKPWILFGMLTAGALTILLYTDFHLQGASYVILFGFLYLNWGMAFTTNDISYWSMLPALSSDQKERERIGSFARICANIGLFTVVAGITPLTQLLGTHTGGIKQGYFWFTVCIVIVLILFQCITLFGVKEPESMRTQKGRQHTKLRDLFHVIFSNDQLLYTAISMTLFIIGYTTTTGFGQYYFKYVYGNENMYSIFAVVLGISQITALVLFPIISQKISRKKLYTIATFTIVIGYLLFFFAPAGNMVPLSIAGVLIFVGEAAVQMLMLMFLADTVEYGEWKSGRRNDSVTFSLQPLIYKMGGAISSVVIGVTVIISGIKTANVPSDVTAEGLIVLKIAMLILPLVCIIAGYIVYIRHFKIDKALYERILAELNARRSLNSSSDKENAK